MDLNLNSNAHGGDTVRVEGRAVIAEEPPPATEIPEYVEKYRVAIARIGLDPSGFVRAYSVAIRNSHTLAGLVSQARKSAPIYNALEHERWEVLQEKGQDGRPGPLDPSPP